MFRQKAIDNHKMRWCGRALLLPGMPFWAVTGSCIFFITALVTFIIAGSYTRRVNVTGEISTWPRAANVYSSVQGVVVKQYVTVGQLISAGSLIYQIDVSKSTRNGVVSKNQRQDINNQLKRITQIISRLESSKKTTLAMLEKQKIQYTAALERSTDILRRAREGIRIMKKNMENYRYYQSRGLINRDQLTNQVALYYQQQNNLLGISAQNELNALQIATLESQIRTQAAEFDNQVNQMELQHFELQKELLNIDAGDTIIIRALTSGRIDSLSVTVGQMVNVGDSLLQVIPQNIDHYSLVLWAPNDAIPYITVGDRVNIRYEAFPAEKFGQFTGKISVISQIPASSQEMQTYPSAPKTALTLSIPYYKIIVRPEKHSIVYAGKRLNLENGMKAQSTLFMEKRRIYQWMLSPFYDMQHSAMGPVHAE